MSRPNRNDSLKAVRVYLDNTITDSGISKIVNRVEREIKKSSQLSEDIKNIEEKLFCLS